MLEYVRVCPKCGHENPESEDICSAPDCGEYLGFVNPVLPSKIIDKQQQQADNNKPEVAKSFARPIESEPKAEKKHAGKVTSRFESPSVFYLDSLGTSQVYEVKSGWILGLEHSTSTAQIQLPHSEGERRYIHREHCSFTCEKGQWFVKAIDHGADTNPTSVNAMRIQPGQIADIKNGDRLTLSNFILQVRITQS